MLKKRINHIHIVAALMLAMIVLGSCKKQETKILSASKLEKVLYDYHLAEALANEDNTDSIEAKAYMDAVLRKHGVSQEEFDATMVYYLRHAYDLNDVYSGLVERISSEARLQGIDDMGTISTDATADTANIWNKEKDYVFFAHPGFNMMKFYFPADSTFKAGDHFQMKLSSDFIFQGGARNGYLVLSMKLANDSVVTRTTSITSSMTYNLEVSDTDRKGVKELRGFLMLRPGSYDNDKNSSMLRIMHIYDISLVKMHVKDVDDNDDDNDDDNVKNKDNEKTDSIKPHGPDSVGIPKRGVHKLHSR